MATAMAEVYDNTQATNRESTKAAIDAISSALKMFKSHTQKPMQYLTESVLQKLKTEAMHTSFIIKKSEYIISVETANQTISLCATKAAITVECKLRNGGLVVENLSYNNKTKEVRHEVSDRGSFA